jgi:hypothetical protein
MRQRSIKQRGVHKDAAGYRPYFAVYVGEVGPSPRSTWPRSTRSGK